MAQVDFTNARITPVASPTGADVNATGQSYLNISGNSMHDASGNFISDGRMDRIKNESKQLVHLYTGTFTASGTEFYIYTYTYNSVWKVSNISFNNGDTYVFSIKADLICQ